MNIVVTGRKECVEYSMSLQVRIIPALTTVHHWTENSWFAKGWGCRTATDHTPFLHNLRELTYVLGILYIGYIRY